MGMRRRIRYMPLIMVVLTTYLAFHVQQDIRIFINKRYLDTSSSLPELVEKTESPLAYEPTTENLVTLPMDTEEIIKPIIKFPLDVDLEEAVRNKIENDIDIPFKLINVNKQKYIHRPGECHFNTTSDVTLLILVKSSVRNIFMRNAIRNTWAGNVGKNIKVLFMLGYSPSLKDTIAMEMGAFGDLIMENFIDAYSNNTLKSMMGFNWAVNKCSSANVILFIDDDHFPNLHNILSYLRSLNPDRMDKLYVGYRINKGSVYRNRRSPWRIPWKVYPYNHWPPYLRGGAFLISQKIARQFSVAFPYVKYLHVDDSYLGLVSLKLNIIPQHDARFMMEKDKILTQKHHFAFYDYKTPNDFKKAWEIIKNQK
ncbi:beta-1,3-galactosyltransferase brn-like [Ylistrum balloti]|uniref:beta-1,3-galactosyltransferase brn-like n=1 Tax=Ylistrum balloti TaxID=509963 RepID=UPI0029058936|nr:beta-1,3-galactosyltransferase brn-like [Ylistrum balloti]